MLERRLIERAERVREVMGWEDTPALLREAAGAIGEARRAMEALGRRWEGIDPDEVFTFRGDSEAIKGVFAALAKLKGGD